MSGSNYIAKGASTGQAPTTIFMGGGPVTERLTLVMPAHIETANGFVNDTVISGMMLNTWTSWNPAFYGGTAGASTILGSTINAPDGTNTAQHIAANTANGFHFISSGSFCPTGGVGAGILVGGIPLRIVFVAKAAELSRCMVQVDDMQGLSLGNQQANSDGAKCVFDLAGGRVGVANTAFGPGGSIAGPTQVIPLGNGFYQCWMDVQLNYGQGAAGVNGFRVSFWLDNGSGTAAQSTSFTGDGTSGIYIWKCCVMPVGAFSLTNVSFFDDFTDPAMGTIDLNNTHAPGFNWYISNAWSVHNYNGLAITPKAKFSQSGSILTINQNPNFHDSDISMETGVQINPAIPGSATVGQFFQPPALFEIRCAYDVSLGSGSDYTGGMCTFWCSAEEHLLQPDPAANSVPYNEMDFFECAAAGSHTVPHTSSHTSAESGDGLDYGNSEQNTSNGTPKWYPNFQYNTNQQVWDPFDNNIYKASTPPNTTTAPHSNLAQWTLVGALPAPIANTGIDLAAQNLFSTLWLPWNTPSGPLPLSMSGTIIQFFNNIPVGFGVLRYGAGLPSGQSLNQYNQIGDKYHYPLFVGCNNNANIYVDYVKVTQ